MTKIFLIIAAIFGGLFIIGGVFSTHALQEKLVNVFIKSQHTFEDDSKNVVRIQNMKDR